MLELIIESGYGENNISKNINYLELIKALEELGIHTKKSRNPFYFILNFKAINYIYYAKGGFGYGPSEYTLVRDNIIDLNAYMDFSFNSIFGIDLDNIYYNDGTVCKIIGYWTNDDEY